jgi:hypothetical protein
MGHPTAMSTENSTDELESKAKILAAIVSATTTISWIIVHASLRLQVAAVGVATLLIVLLVIGRR